jgi:uncharacterized protein (UPF0332 family)
MTLTSIKYDWGVFKIESLKNLENLRITTYQIDDLKLPFDLKPEEFIKYAKADLKLKSNRGIVNALSNTKRALHCQLDSLLYAFGYQNKSRKGRWNFNDKLEFLGELDIITPEFLRKINKQRNFLEHEYALPSRENVEDAIDIAILFIDYTQKHLNKILIDCVLNIKNKADSPEIRFDRKNSKFIVSDPYPDNKILKEFDIDTPEFLVILKAFAHFDKLFLTG